MIKLSGIIIPLESPNRNGRVYPREELEKAVAKFNDKYDAKGIQCLGQICNGNSPDVDSFESRMSHTVSECALTDDGVVATITLLETDGGKGLRELLETGVDTPTYRLSPVLTGKVGSDGVVSDLELVRVDLSMI